LRTTRSFTKEDSAWFFRGLRGKPAAIPAEGPFFIAVDFFEDRFDGSMKVIPYHFAIGSASSIPIGIGFDPHRPYQSFLLKRKKFFASLASCTFLANDLC
jgi:hypothetical protein